ncbi:hypothetical protein A4A49_03093 [Nicotiana attenuata]|uniref:F-box domain-containing protein n=1 Tax=Nicotiana attenuata TaxID=49451 RepID=A0A1J6ISI3_NICAT|nr:hypothetical protein A4A49_03093 [Nicotiana attenuata]
MARTQFEKLHEEMIAEILSRLPAKLIGQSRCVSKQWCSILSGPQLIKAHLTFHSHKYEEEKLITVCRSQSLHALTFNQNGNGVVSRKLDFQQQLSDNWVTVGGSCNGLVLAVNDKQITFLINPTTLKYHRIPDSGNASIVALECPNRLRWFPDVAYGVFVRGIWENGVLVNGALHWLASEDSDYSPVIVAFEIFSGAGPTTIDKGKHVISKLVALRGCLCILSETEETNTTWIIKNTMWTMKDYGIEESCTKFEVKGPDDAGLIPLCFMSEDDVVLDACASLIAYNRREDQ